MRRATKGEKTTVGKVENFGLIENNKYFAYKYKAIIKSVLRKYEIESYSKFLELIDECKIYEIIDILNKYIKDMKLDNNKQLI